MTMSDVTGTHTTIDCRSNGRPSMGDPLTRRGCPRIRHREKPAVGILIFPPLPLVHYVTAAVDMIATKSVSASIEIITTGMPTFEYALEANNTCVSPAHV